MVGLGEVTGHGLGACWPDNGQGRISFESPRSEDQVREPHSVVGVKVSQEQGGEPFHLQPLDPSLEGFVGSPNNPRSGVHEVRGPVHDHGQGGPSPVWLCIRRPRPQKNQLGGFRRAHLWLVESGRREEDGEDKS